MSLLDHIPVGEANAVSTAELLHKSNFRTVRAMQKEIHELRESGVVICSRTDPPGGYYRPANAAEATRFVRGMESRCREIESAIKAARRYIDDIPEP